MMAYLTLWAEKLSPPWNGKAHIHKERNYYIYRLESHIHKERKYYMPVSLCVYVNVFKIISGP